MFSCEPPPSPSPSLQIRSVIDKCIHKLEAAEAKAAERAAAADRRAAERATERAAAAEKRAAEKAAERAAREAERKQTQMKLMLVGVNKEVWMRVRRARTLGRCIHTQSNRTSAHNCECSVNLSPFGLAAPLHPSHQERQAMSPPTGIASAAATPTGQQPHAALPGWHHVGLPVDERSLPDARSAPPAPEPLERLAPEGLLTAADLDRLMQARGRGGRV